MQEITDPKEILKTTLELCSKMDYLDNFFLSFSLHQNLGTFAFHRDNMGGYISIFQMVHGIVDNNGPYKCFRSIKEAHDYIDNIVPNNIDHITIHYSINFKHFKHYPVKFAYFNYFLYKNGEAFFGCDKNLIRKKINLIAEILKSVHKLKTKNEFLDYHEELVGTEEELLGRKNQLIILKNKINNFDQSKLNDRITTLVQNKKQNNFGERELIDYVQQMENLLKEDWRHSCRDEYQLNIELRHILRRCETMINNLDTILQKIVPNYTNKQMEIFLGKMRYSHIIRQNELVDSKTELQLILDEKKKLQKEVSNKADVALMYTKNNVHFGKKRKITLKSLKMDLKKLVKG